MCLGWHNYAFDINYSNEFDVVTGFFFRDIT